MISDAIALYEMVRRIYNKRTMISAMFDWQGNRIDGDDRLIIHLHLSQEDKTIWWYSVEPFEDFQFIRIPVNVGGVVETYGAPEKNTNPIADYFRYISVPDGKLYSKKFNVKVSFMVFAYRPRELLSNNMVAS